MRASPQSALFVREVSVHYIHEFRFDCTRNTLVSCCYCWGLLLFREKSFFAVTIIRNIGTGTARRAAI
jgi:hypothetical protein